MKDKTVYYNIRKIIHWAMSFYHFVKYLWFIIHWKVSLSLSGVFHCHFLSDHILICYLLRVVTLTHCPYRKKKKIWLFNRRKCIYIFFKSWVLPIQVALQTLNKLVSLFLHFTASKENGLKFRRKYKCAFKYQFIFLINIIYELVNSLNNLLKQTLQK